MPSKRPGERFREIIEEIDFIDETLHDLDFQAFLGDSVKRHAVERAFAIISEAAVKLGDDADLYAPGIPWRNIRGIGNFIRHEYDGVDHTTLWEVREQSFPELREACLKALAQINRPKD